MASNKFATMLHRNTNKMTVILVYVILEWTLIALLLFNSLFSYLILKFADYFGLKRPCLLCSRLDHLFERPKTNVLHRDLVCEAHAREISSLSYCLAHRRLAESSKMCDDCSPSSPAAEWPNKLSFFPFVKQIGVINDDGDDHHDDCEEEENCKCCCCGAGLSSRRFYPPCILIEPSSWGVLDYAEKKSVDDDDQTFEADRSDHSGSDSAVDQRREEQGIEENRGIQMVSGGSVQGDDVRGEEDEIAEKVEEEEGIEEENFGVWVENDGACEQRKVEENTTLETAISEIPVQHLEFYIGQEDCTLIPVDLTESAETEEQKREELEAEEKDDLGNQDVILDFNMEMEAQVELVTETWHSSEAALELVSSNTGADVAELEAVVFRADGGELEASEFPALCVSQGTQTVSDDENGDYYDHDGKAMEMLESDFDAQQGSDDDIHMQSDEVDGEISIGTEIPDHEPIDEFENQESLNSYPRAQDDPSISSISLDIDDIHVLNFERAEQELLEFKPLSVHTSERELVQLDNHLAFGSEMNDNEEEKVPDTPSSIDSLHLLHKKLLLLERREQGAEDSLDDGSVMSDVEGMEGIQVIEKLKKALKAERKALSTLYMELEEERSASAVAASQTMAMINRLQEEKAAMQMEALQYQRMMEEQSEYDQEALQLLNELMIKREKEKQELEKELELYRKKVQDFEAKDRMVFLRRSRNSSATCSNTEDSDGLSVDLNNEAKEEEERGEGCDETSNQNTPTEAVHYLEESLAGFEEERLSILDQLRVLEEKLFTLSDGEEENHFEDIKPIEHLHSENGNGYHEDTNGLSNGHSKEANGKHDHYQDKRIMGAKAKRLLPFFDATEEEAENGVSDQNGEGYDYGTMQDSSVFEFEQKSERPAIENEVDHVYERLQALEADREFLKHCISSLRKGDKGLCLLREILQHLRDLRSVEHSVRNMGNGVL